MAFLYDIYFNEKSTITEKSNAFIKYPVDDVVKNERATIPIGLFTTNEHNDVSAVIYSTLATWGKIKALSKKPHAMSIFIPFILPNIIV